jgi:hypothetical protein
MGTRRGTAKGGGMMFAAYTVAFCIIVIVGLMVVR